MAWWERAYDLIAQTAARLACTGSSHKAQLSADTDAEREVRALMSSNYRIKICSDVSHKLVEVTVMPTDE